MIKYFILFTLILTSCSSVDRENNEVLLFEDDTHTKINSYPQTQRERLLESYRLMRARRWNEIKNRKVSRPTRNERQIEYKKVTITPPAPKPEPVYKIKYVDETEQQVEIEQNLIYFCMNDRRGRTFNNDEECEEYSKNLYEKCLDDYEQGDARLTHCIKSRLR